MSGEATNSADANPVRLEPLSRENPWPGLESFSTEDTAFFAGRDEEIDAVCRMIRRHPHGLLYGQSGLGKTSLLRAGVMPRLRQEHLVAVYVRLAYGTPETLVDQVKEALIRELRERGIDGPRPQPGETLWEYFHHADHFLWDHAERVALVLIFDQFEEIFTLGRQNEARREAVESLLEELECLIEGTPPPAVEARLNARPAELQTYDLNRSDFRVVWSLREDFLPEINALRERFRQVQHNYFRLEALDGRRGLEAVLRPGAQLVEEATARRIVSLVAGRQEAASQPPADDPTLARERIEPALLSLMCFELNQRRREGNPPRQQIDLDLVRSASGRILTDFYRRCVEGLPDAVCAFIEERLLTGQGKFRQAAAEEDFLGVSGSTSEMLTRLVERRLLRRDERYRARTVELTHDILVAPVGEFRRQRQAKLRQEAETRQREKTEQRRREAEDALARRNRQVQVLAFATVLILGFGLLAVYWWRSAEKSGREATKQSTQANSLAKELGKALHAAEESGRAASNNAVLARTNQLRAELAASNAVHSAQQTEIALNSSMLLQRELAEQNKKLEQAKKEAEDRRDEARTAQRAEQAALRTNVVTLFESYLNSAVLLSRNGAFAEASRALQSSTNYDAQIAASRLSTRNLVRWFVESRGASPSRTGGTEGATRPLRDLAVSVDGNWLATAGEGGEVALYPLKAPNGTTTKRWLAHASESSVRYVAFSPDGASLVSAGDDQLVRRWLLPGGFAAGEWRLSSPPVALALSPNGRWIAAGTKDGHVRLLPGGNGGTSSSVPEIELPTTFESLSSLAFAPQGEVLFAGSSSGRVWAIDLKGFGEGRRLDPKLVREVVRFDGAVNEIVVLRDGRRLVTGCDDGTLQVWTVDVGRLVRVLRGHRGRIEGLCIGSTPNGEVLVSGGWDRSVRLWNLETGDLLATFEGAMAAVTAVASSSREPIFYSASNDGAWRGWRWPVPTSLNPARLSLASQDSRPGGLATNTSCALSPDASRLAVGSEDGTLWMYQLPGGERRWYRQAAHAGRISRMAFSPDGRELATVGFDGQWHRWDVNTGGSRASSDLSSRAQALNDVSFSPDGHRVVVAGLARTHFRVVADPAAIRERGTALIGVVEVESGRVQWATGDGSQILSVGWSSSGARLLNTDDRGNIELRGVPGLAREFRWPRDEGSSGAGGGSELAWGAFGPKDARIAVAGREGRLSFLTGNLEVEGVPLVGHENTIVRGAFSPDGAQVFTASSDGTLRAWDVEQRSELFALPLGVPGTVRDPIHDFAFAALPDSGEAWLAVPLVTGTVEVFRLGPIYRRGVIEAATLSDQKTR